MGKRFPARAISVYTLLSTATKTEIAHLGLPEASESVLFCFLKKVGKVTFINYCHLQFTNSIVKLKNKQAN